MEWIEPKGWRSVALGLGTIGLGVLAAWLGHGELALVILGAGTLAVPAAIGKRGAE